jgi:hypothetical protein
MGIGKGLRSALRWSKVAGRVAACKGPSLSPGFAENELRTLPLEVRIAEK